MAKRETFLGSIALTGLVNETIIRNGKKGIFIPINDNPSIYFQQKENGDKIINLDIEVKPTPNSQYGNSHLVKASVGKANRQKFNLQGDALNRATPILGNLKRFEFEARESGSGYAPQNGAPAGRPEDLPAEFDGAW